ncbi:hypothetical protein [Desulfovibrio sp. ZJ200]|uniref:hypothetical protein n=1 Tax=Desulfovibrio sp. ZJ200 TaxID=2709792 RepID=UPI00197E833F|nr:hypothetical protein [Desulfovibrio sp. ZJ200]
MQTLPPAICLGGSVSPQETGCPYKGEENYGGVTIAWPTGRVPVKITATMRDNADRRIRRHPA